MQQERTDRQLVYVVDDEPLLASSLATIIQAEGFDARRFTNPLEALEAAKLLAPDLLLTDVIMPEMTGIELAIRVSIVCARCKVLLLSGQAATADLFDRPHYRGYRFELLAKPIDPLNLIAKLKDVFAVKSPTPAA